jgi:hypothetical protein
MAFKNDTKGEFENGNRAFKPDAKGVGGLLGGSDGESSGGGGFVVVSFIGPAGIDVRNLAATMLMGNATRGQRSSRAARLQGRAARALEQSRKETKESQAAKEVMDRLNIIAKITPEEMKQFAAYAAQERKPEYQRKPPAKV